MTKILKKNRNKKELPCHDEITYDNPTSNTTDNKSLVLPQGCEWDKEVIHASFGPHLTVGPSQGKWNTEQRWLRFKRRKK